MKKLLLLPLLFLLPQGKATAQLQHLMLDSNAYWCAIAAGLSGSGNVDYWPSKPRFTDVDVSSTGIRTAEAFVEYPGAGMVLYRDSQDTFLLYDYTLQEGDTFHWHRMMLDTIVKMENTHVPADSLAAGISIVTTRDSVTLLNGEQRLRLFLNSHFKRTDSSDFEMSYHAMTWIDGIGCTLGWFYPKYGTYFESSWKFTAYYYDSTLLYSWGLCLEVGIDDPAASVPSLKPWPNPAQDVLNVDAGAPILRAQAIDLTGRSYPLQATSSELDLSFLSPGWYFLRVQTREGFRNGKFIKQ